MNRVAPYAAGRGSLAYSARARSPAPASPEAQAAGSTTLTRISSARERPTSAGGSRHGAGARRRSGRASSRAPSTQQRRDRLARGAARRATSSRSDGAPSAAQAAPPPPAIRRAGWFCRPHAPELPHPGCQRRQSPPPRNAAPVRRRTPRTRPAVPALRRQQTRAAEQQRLHASARIAVRRHAAQPRHGSSRASASIARRVAAVPERLEQPLVQRLLDSAARARAARSARPCASKRRSPSASSAAAARRPRPAAGRRRGRARARAAAAPASARSSSGAPRHPRRQRDDGRRAAAGQRRVLAGVVLEDDVQDDVGVGGVARRARARGTTTSARAARRRRAAAARTDRRSRRRGSPGPGPRPGAPWKITPHRHAGARDQRALRETAARARCCDELSRSRDGRRVPPARRMRSRARLAIGAHHDSAVGVAPYSKPARSATIVSSRSLAPRGR